MSCAAFNRLPLQKKCPQECITIELNHFAIKILERLQLP